MNDKNKESTEIAEFSDELVALKKSTARSITIVGILILIAGILSLIVSNIQDDNTFKLYGGILLMMSGWIFYRY